MIDRYGEAESSAHFRAFDTIRSATQNAGRRRPSTGRGTADLAVVIGGYNSSNTATWPDRAERVPTFHIADPGCLVSATEIRHRPIGQPSTAAAGEIVTRNWLPGGTLRVGLTAGASTPNNIVGEVIERLEALALG